MVEPAMTRTEHTAPWERRWHPLREEWVIVAAHRQNRPWIGHRAAAAPAAVPSHDPSCTFCPGNIRVSGERNPDYEGVHAFDNDHPCVGPDAPDPAPARAPLRSAPARGRARVICFDPRHDVSLAALDVDGVAAVLEAYRDEERSCAADSALAQVLAFENRGEVVGVSNPHPHGQLYATDFVFPTMAVEARACERHHRETGRALLLDVVAEEERDRRRMVSATDRAVAFVPHFARWAYEVFVVPRRPVASFKDLDDDSLRDLATSLRDVLRRYDALWSRPFPYVLAFHSAPLRESAPGFQFHAELHPPLRKPDLLKHLAGPEIGGGTFLADTAPETTAAELRDVDVAQD